MANLKIIKYKADPNFVAIFVDGAGAQIDARDCSMDAKGKITIGAATIDLATTKAYPIAFASHADQAALEKICADSGHTVTNPLP